MYHFKKVVTLHTYIWRLTVSLCLVVANVRFDQQVYTVSEADGRVESVLVLSNPSSSAITVQVFSTDGSATTGK